MAGLEVKRNIIGGVERVDEGAFSPTPNEIPIIISISIYENVVEIEYAEKLTGRVLARRFERYISISVEYENEEAVYVMIRTQTHDKMLFRVNMELKGLGIVKSIYVFNRLER